MGDEPELAAEGMHTIAVTNSYDAGQLTIAEKIVSHLNELTIGDLYETKLFKHSG